jgi:hypothetical protein
VSGAGLADDAVWTLAELLRSLIWGLFNEWRLTGDTDQTQRNERARSAARILATAIP